MFEDMTIQDPRVFDAGCNKKHAFENTFLKSRLVRPYDSQQYRFTLIN